MLDIKFLRQNPDVVKENIKKKFQDEKLPLVDEVIELDKRNREIKGEVEALRAEKNKVSKEIGACMAHGEKEKAEELKKKVQENAARMEELSAEEKEVEAKIKKDMMVIPNIIDPSVPIGKDDSQNVEIEKFGEPVVPDFEIPYHTEIMEKFNGIDLESAGKVAGNGFYYLMGDIARLHSAVISYARDFMIDRGFTYCIPPFMIRSNVVTGVMSFAEMDSMMYKIEGEDLYLIGTSEHSMIGKFIDTMLDEAELPKTLTSYSPCFRKEKGAHGIEERGVYRIHQFEKQEMIVVCKPEESKEWYDKLWKNTVDLFRSLDIPVRTLECCSGDLADLKVKSCDVEAWSPRQKKYFEVGSCSNLGDAQARRLRIRIKGENGNYFANDINDYFSLLSCLPDYYNELAEFESQKAKRGLFMSDASLERLLTQCQTMLSSDYLASAFKDKINSLQNADTLTKKQADSYLSLHEKLIHTCVIPSYQSLSEKLSALKGSEKNDRGLAGFPDGTAYYHYLIQSQVGDFRSTNEIEERLFTQLALDYRQMQTLLSQNPSLAQNLSVFSLSATPEEMLSYLNKAMQTDFPDLDSPKYEVKYVPTSMEEFSSPAFYLTPPADTLSPNTIYINRSSQVNPAELFTTLAHEGFPGHLYQTLYYGNQNPAPIRNLLGCSGYIEGWATYVESISYGYAASYFKVEPELLQLLWQNRSISLCLYSLLDIKIHEYGWTLAQVTQSLHGFGIASDDTCKEIYQYIIENPANYLKYYLGYLNFMDLRDLAEKKAGDKFDKKEFHRFVLETGPAPFPVIEKYVLENY